MMNKDLFCYTTFISVFLQGSQTFPGPFKTLKTQTLVFSLFIQLFSVFF